MAIGAIAQAAVPKLARLHQHHHLKFLHLIGLVAIPAIVAGLIGISIAAMAGRVFLTHLYNSTYQEYTETFLWMMIAAAILYLVSVTGCALTSVRLFLHQASITTFSTVTTILACLILVPTHGLTGAAMSLCVGFLTKLGGQMAILILCLRRNTSQGIANQ
jgi:O-antigen/teichoic acid export membrane protein